MNKLPQAKKNIVVQNAEKELLIYDLNAHKAYILNETSTIVFNACYENIGIEQIKKRHQFTDDLIYLTLDKLQTNNLIEGEAINYFGNLSRRETIKKVGLASLAALPVVAALVAPTSARAASVCFENNAGCEDDSVCCSGICSTSLQTCCQNRSSFVQPNAGSAIPGASEADCRPKLDDYCCNGPAVFSRYDEMYRVCYFICH